MNVGLAAVVLATASPTPIVASNGGGDGASGSDTGDSTPWAHRVCGGPHLTGSRVKVQVLAGALGDGGAATGPLESSITNCLSERGCWVTRPGVVVRGFLPVTTLAGD